MKGEESDTVPGYRWELNEEDIHPVEYECLVPEMPDDMEAWALAHVIQPPPAPVDPRFWRRSTAKPVIVRIPCEKHSRHDLDLPGLPVGPSFALEKASPMSKKTNLRHRALARCPQAHDPCPGEAAWSSPAGERDQARPIGYEHLPMEVMREDASIHKLLDMLETCRPGGSEEEEAFIETYLSPLEPFVDGYGNRHVEVATPEGHPRIMWSVHTDTVHRHGGTQKVEVTQGMAWTSDGSCLGSDDTVGIWLALEMIQAKVPGTYIFHREEESGGGGSMWLAKQGLDAHRAFDAAIALDRAGYSDVITHQGGGRCCSDVFAESLAKLLGGSFKPCDRGVFTDTANYVDLIGECTNLSVGYFSQHGPTEHTHLGFASRMRDALIAADWSQLVLKREAGEVDEDAYRGYVRGDYDDKWGTTYNTKRKDRGAPAYGSHDDEVEAMEAYVKEFPWVVAEYLVEMGVNMEELDVYEPGDLS